jgi:demethylmenaquinone methyltransferase/2-methoxy-6-polyprenyl-1,4-benzoquinol methylase
MGLITSPDLRDKVLMPSTDVRALFDTICPKYDLMNRLLSCGLNTLWLKRLVQAVLDTHPTNYLDLCCGTGAVAARLATSCKGGPPLPIDCADFSPAMIAVAKARLSTLGTPFRTFVADATALPFDDSSYDTISLSYGIRNIQDKHAAIREAARVLRPGGHLCILELTQPHRLVRPFHALYLKTIVPLIGAVVTGHREPYQYLPSSIQGFSITDLMSTLCQHGFSSQPPEPLSFGIATIIIAEKNV